SHCPTPGLKEPQPNAANRERAPQGRHVPNSANGTTATMVMGSNGTSLHKAMILRMRISLRWYRTPC
ncbi:MAG TPA: hypothetical protein DCL71_02865, partial [Bifidobacterium sp.]|nr:hypothetical protein [Bifidobacterium sp.]